MDKKTIVLTSGTAGIGKSIAKTLLEDDKINIERFIINYGHDDENAKKFMDELSEAHREKVNLVKSDLSNETGYKNFIADLNTITTEIDWLILNTGIGTYISFDEYSLETWDSILTTNVSIPAMLVKELKPSMKKKGKVVFTGSYAGIEPYSSSVAYGVSKAAVHFLAKTLVKELEEKDVSVNAIAPAFVETRWQDGRSDESRNRINNKIAAHRFGTPEEVAELYKSVLTNDYINGTILEITGGYNYF